MQKIYNLLVTQKYDTKQGEAKTRYHNVGTMGEFAEGGGFWLELPPGVSVSGRFVAMPRRQKSNGSTKNE